MYSAGYLPILCVIVGFLSAFILSTIFVPIAKVIALRFNILDIPDGKVKKHAVATPYLGGIAVYFATLITSFFIVPYDSSIFLLLCGTTILLIVGLIDDLVVMRPSQKFIGQSIAVLIFLYGGFYLHIFACSFFAMALSALWILTIINAFNLIDVMDGLATSVACSATCGFIIVALYLQQPVIAGIFACFAGALIGFLLYNWPHASIYLGDTGSLFIGGLLGALPLSLNFGALGHWGYLAPLILLAIPLLELTSLIVIRTSKKIPFYQGSPDHFSMYLQRHGWSKKNILFYVWIMSIILIGTTSGFVAGLFHPYQIIFFGLIFLFIWFVFLVRGCFLCSKNCSK